jgi:hypothetical protein
MTELERCINNTVLSPVDNSNYSRYREGSVKKRILRFLKDRQTDCSLGYSPSQIAKICNTPLDQTRARLKELTDDGKVSRLFHGNYVANPLENTPKTGYGLAECGYLSGVDVLPRVQNLVFVADVGKDLTRDLDDPDPLCFGDVSIWVTFGDRSGKMTVRVGTSYGLFLAGFDLLVDKLHSLTDGYGFDDVVWNVTNYEFFTDFASYRLEGNNCVTISAFRWEMIKLYNKVNALRLEFRGSVPLTIEAVRRLMMSMGALSPLEIAKAVRVWAELVETKYDI